MKLTITTQCHHTPPRQTLTTPRVSRSPPNPQPTYKIAQWVYSPTSTFLFHFSPNEFQAVGVEA